jgi:hypothetical protein
MNPSDEIYKKTKHEIKASKENHFALKSSVAPQEPITILCVKFGDKYGREYVERLRNMIERNITIPYEIVCLTDDKHPIDRVRSIVQPNAGYTRGWWHKVHMFDPDLPLKGTILYFDLDVVIHKKIDKLASVYPNEFLGILDFNRKFFQNWQNLNSSVLRWEHGKQKYIWERFKQNPAEAMKLHGDQDWIWLCSKTEIKFWPREWIQSYKWEIRKKEDLMVVNGKRKFSTVNDSVKIPGDCCVTVFHGDPKPDVIKDKFVLDNWQ